MGKDGICRVQGKTYSKTIRFYDINYQLAQNEDKNAIFENWCDFLNYFDSGIHFQLSFINHKSSMEEFENVISMMSLMMSVWNMHRCFVISLLKVTMVL